MLDPALIVLDEPFSGLDPLNVRLVGTLVREARHRGAAVLLSAHQLQLVAELCDTILMLASGRVVVSGATSDIVTPGRDLETMFVERAEAAGVS
jgi:ABC-2 type transport system ATP-binding protein